MLTFDEKTLKKKLADWVLNAHLPELLGIEKEKKDELRETFDKLVEEGVLLTEGKRRGLRFKFNPDHKPREVEKEEEAEEEVALDEDEIFDVAPTVGCVKEYVRQRDQHVAMVQAASYEELLDWLLTSAPDKDSSICSTTISIKKLSDGSISLKAYAGIKVLLEKNFSTVDGFKKFMKKSNNNKETK